MERADLGVGFSKSNFLKFAGDYASDRGVNFKGGVATEKRWRGLKQRHPDFSLGSPEATSAGRHIAMTRQRILNYFGALKSELDTLSLMDQHSKIWNMDETGLSLCHKPNKVIAKKGTKVVHCKMSSSRELVTVVACANANGAIMPPHVTVPGKTQRVFQGYDTENAPENTNLSVSNTGWTKQGIAKLWFTDTFLPNIGNERPQVLILDGHDSHNHYEFVKLARQEQISLTELPSKTSNWTQPLDRAVFKSLKSKWSDAIQSFNAATGVVVGHAQFFRVFKKAWEASMTPENIKSGFVSTGICPYNPGAIPNCAFTPSELYVDDNHQTDTSVTVSTSLVEPTTQTTDSLQQSAVTLYTSTFTPSTVSGIESDPFLPMTLPPSPVQIETVETSDAAPVIYDTSIPTGSDVVDLPLTIGDDGILSLFDLPPTPRRNSSEKATVSSSTTSVTECDNNTALQVVESTMTDEMKTKFQVAFETGVELDDSLYKTWKMYKSPQKVQENSTQLKIPLQKKSVNLKKRKQEQYFIISCNEAFNAKQKAYEEKELKKRQSGERKRTRVQQKEEREKMKLEKVLKKMKRE